jgi:transcriptional regulator with XRE-family HTH domain
MKDAIVPAQSRAGRALLDWSREKLAAESGVPSRTVADFELSNTAPRAITTAAIRTALETAGVEFTNGDAPGVRLRKTGDRA